MLGWLYAYFSKLIKSPFILRYQMRGKGRKIFHVLRHMRFFIYNRIPERVLKKHEVTKALKDQQALEKDAKKAVKAEFDLAFDAQIEEALSLKEVGQIEKVLLQHEELHGPTGYEAEFGRKVAAIIANAHGDDRKVYFTYVEPIMKVAEKSGDHRVLMAQIRTLGPDQLDILAAIALRLEIRTASKELKKLRADKRVINSALSEWDAAKKDKQKAEQHLKTVLKEMEKDLETDLHNDTLIVKRDFLLTLLTLRFINDEEVFDVQYYRDNVMPKIPEQERIRDFEQLKVSLGEHAHVLAQGLRRIMAAEEDAQKKAQQIEALGRGRRKAAA